MVVFEKKLAANIRCLNCLYVILPIILLQFFVLFLHILAVLLLGFKKTTPANNLKVIVGEENKVPILVAKRSCQFN